MAAPYICKFGFATAKIAIKNQFCYQEPRHCLNGNILHAYKVEDITFGTPWCIYGPGILQWLLKRRT